MPRLALAMICLVIGAAPALAQSSSSAGARICGWFSPAEIGKYLGAAVKAGEVNGPLDSQCQWVGQSDSSRTFISIQMVSARHWEVPDQADDFRRVKGVGDAAYVLPEFGGWKAAAKAGKEAVYVSGGGETLTAEKTLDLLRAALAHR